MKVMNTEKYPKKIQINIIGYDENVTTGKSTVPIAKLVASGGVEYFRSDIVLTNYGKDPRELKKKLREST